MNIREKIDTIKTKLSGDTRSYQLLLNIVIIILVNIAAVNLNVRVDLTRNNTYSLTEKSKGVVENLKENMKVKVLFSENLPAEHSTILRYLKDLLQEYSYHGNRYFSYEIVGEKELEKQARDYGIQPVSSREFVDDQVKIRRTYMGVVIQHADLMEKIPALTDPSGLEYAITSRMEKMSAKIDGLLNLKEPIKLTLYLDSRLKQLPIDGIDKIKKGVSEAVEKSNRVNYGKIKFSEKDPAAGNKKVDAGAIYGLQRVRWGAGRTPDGKAMKAGEGALGIVLTTGKRFKTIELNVAPTLFGSYTVVGLDKMEDKINDAVSSLLSSTTRIGYLTGHGIPDLKDQRTRNGAALFKKVLDDKYELVGIDATKKEISPDINVLIVAGPKQKLEDIELYRIDQFLMKGKKVIFLVDSYQEVQMPGGQNMFRQRQPVVLPVQHGLDAMLKSYGVMVNKNVVLDSSCAKVNMGQMIKDYPVMPIIERDGLNRDSIITRYLNSALFMKASSVTVDEKKLKENKTVATKLVSSSDESWLMKGRVNFNPFMMNPGRAEDMKSHDLAWLLSGKFTSFFKGKEVPVQKDVKKPENKRGRISSVARLDESIASGKPEIIVVGSAELIRSGFLSDSRKILSRGRRNEAYANDNLVHGMVDYMAGNDYIPEMLSKSLEFNPLERSDDSERFIMKSVNIAGVPLLVILAGIIIWRRRGRRRKQIQQQFMGGIKDE